MKISSVEKHQRTHIYKFQELELKKLAIEKIASELGLELSQKNLIVDARLIRKSNGINPSTYECEVSIIENLDYED